MLPSQTSLIPVTVALVRFVETHGFSSFLGNYPYWYLGSTPLRYLSGPVVPLFLIGARRLLSDISLFSITIYLILVTFLIGAAGWGVLAKRISGNRIIGTSVGFLTLIFPWRYFSSLALGEATFVVARNFLPLALIAFWEYLGKRSGKTAALAILVLAFLLLINTSILPILIVGVSGLVLARSLRKEKLKNISKYIKPSLFIIFTSLFLVTFWYTPSYWWTILANPSIGGASGIKVILRIFDLLRVIVPLVLAIVAVYFSAKIKSRLTVFSLVWVFTFLFLTLFRFIGDPDFWMDWTAWLWELEVGVALLVAQRIQNAKHPNIQTSKKPKFKIFNFEFAWSFGDLKFGVLLIIPFALTFYVYNLLGKPALISKEVPGGVRSLEKLAETAGDKRVFLSGSTVFWANALYDLKQVRGGRDQVATHPTWDKAAYELREEVSSKKARKWLEELNVSYVLVHGPGSPEYYHDFENIEKWDEVGEVVWEDNGDTIYKVLD